jgi:hypothetical protein
MSQKADTEPEIIIPTWKFRDRLTSVLREDLPRA